MSSPSQEQEKKFKKQLEEATEISFMVDSGKEGITVKNNGEMVANEWNRIIEQVYDPHNGSRFCIFDATQKKVEGYFRFYFVGSQCFRPRTGEDIQKGVVLLPSSAEDYGSEEGLLQEIEDFLRRWVGVSEHFYKIGVQYILTTWLYDKFDTINYLRALGDTGTGKSRFLNAFGGLCYKYINIAGAVRAAPVYRVIERWKGTLGIEEADFDKSDETQEIIKIINCGFEKNNPVMRCDKDHPDKLQFFSTFCPKVIATRRNFTDVATEARCLTERMFQDETKPDTKTREFYAERERLRNKLLMFRFKNYFSVDVEKVLDVDLSFLEPRLRQASRPFLAMVWDKPPLLEKFKDFLRKYQEDVIDVRASSYDGQIVEEIYNLVLVGEKNITPSMLAEKVGEKANARSIGKRLRNLGLNIEQRRVEGRVLKCIVLDMNILMIIFKRYIKCIDVSIVSFVSFVSESIKTENHQTELNSIVSPPVSIGNDTNDTIDTQENAVEENNPKDTIKAFIRFHQNDVERNGSIVLAACEQLGYSSTLLEEMRSKGEICELPADHWRVLE